jgi:stage II sporulation protein D
MHSRTRQIVLALAAGVILLASGGPADAARGVAANDLAVPITPATTTITINGHGFGHGHGMSQYGAKGAAIAGLSAQQILAFYYPGTALTSLSAGIKVLISSDVDNNLTIEPAGGLRVRDLGNGRTYRLRTKNTPRLWRLVRLHGHTKVFYKTSRWHLYKTGGRRFLAGDGEFRSSTGLLSLKLPSGFRSYRGRLRYVNGDTVNVLTLEKYLKGVIASEMPASWPAAALQAQAVAARTYAARERADNINDYYQICDTTACQVYGGVASEQAASNAAGDATAGQVLTYGGQYAFAQFSASSGGLTSAGSQPYLPAQQDPYDTTVVDPTYRTWAPATIDVTPLRAAYAAAHPGGTLTSVQVTEREDPVAPDQGRVVTVALVGDASPEPVPLSGSQFQSLFKLRSTYFVLTP